jgi:hypothetical protein
MNKQTSTHMLTHAHMKFICLLQRIQILELLSLQSIQKKTTLLNSVLYLLTAAATVQHTSVMAVCHTL